MDQIWDILLQHKKKKKNYSYMKKRDEESEK